MALSPTRLATAASTMHAYVHGAGLSTSGHDLNAERVIIELFTGDVQIAAA